MIKYFLFIIWGFFSGSIMFSYLIPKVFYKKDIIELAEDKNPGTSNVIHFVGIFPGMLCLFLDLFKGTLPIYYAVKHLNINNLLFAFVIASPILGHAFSPFLKFHGGKAIAATFGAFLGLLPCSKAVLYLIVIMIFLSLIVKIYPHSLRVIISMIAFSICCVLFESVGSIILGAIIVSGIVIIKHLANYGNEKFKISLLFSSKSAEKHLNT